MHDGQSRDQRQGVDASRIGDDEWVAADIECVCATLKRLDRGGVIFARPDSASYDVRFLRDAQTIESTTSTLIADVAQPGLFRISNALGGLRRKGVVDGCGRISWRPLLDEVVPRCW
jgi:hypothetical protein